MSLTELWNVARELSSSSSRLHVHMQQLERAFPGCRERPHLLPNQSVESLRTLVVSVLVANRREVPRALLPHTPAGSPGIPPARASLPRNGIEALQSLIDRSLAEKPHHDLWQKVDRQRETFDPALLAVFDRTQADALRIGIPLYATHLGLDGQLYYEYVLACQKRGVTVPFANPLKYGFAFGIAVLPRHTQWTEIEIEVLTSLVQVAGEALNYPMIRYVGAPLCYAPLGWETLVNREIERRGTAF